MYDKQIIAGLGIRVDGGSRESQEKLKKKLIKKMNKNKKTQKPIIKKRIKVKTF